MGIVEEDIARVRAATDFVALASEHLALRRVGRSWVGLCPFHGERSPSFNLNAELGLYHCYGCQAGGDVITFVREIEHLDFAEAVEFLAGRAGIALRYDEAHTGRDHQRRTRIHETLEAAVEWYHRRLLEAPDAAAARAYLRRERGYDGEVVRRYRLGWAPEGWSELVRSLGVAPATLADAGLAYVNDRGSYTDSFRARLLFPIFEPGGRPVGAGGRILPGGRPPKYKNTTGTAVYDKSRTLYGLNWAKGAVVERGQVVVCEGYTDVIGLHGAGVGEAVATCGTALADGHIRSLTNFARRIILAYDADAAGQSAADKVAGWEQRFEVDIRVAALPQGSDPADLARTDPDALRAAIEDARPFLAFRLQRLFARSDLATVEGRARAATEAAQMIAAHPNGMVRDQYLMEVADRCRVEPARLRQQLAAAGSEGRNDGRQTNDNRAGSSRRPGATAHGPNSEPTERPAGSAPTDSVLGVAEQDGVRALGTVPAVELEALRLAVQRREMVGDRLDLVLFGHPLSRSAFTALCQAASVQGAIDITDAQTASLLGRLAVDPDEGDLDSVVLRLVERAGLDAVAGLRAELRSSDDPEQAAGYSEIIGWLKLAIEMLRAEDADGGPQLAREAENRLVRWLIDREEARQTDEFHEGGTAIRDQDGGRIGSLGMAGDARGIMSVAEP